MVTRMLAWKRSSSSRVREHVHSNRKRENCSFNKNRFYRQNQFDDPANRFNNEQIESTVRFQRRLAFVIWSLFILFWSYCLLAFIKIKFYVLLVCLFHVVLDTFANGIIDFVCQLDVHYRQSQLKKSQSAIKQDWTKPNTNRNHFGGIFSLSFVWLS